MVRIGDVSWRRALFCSIGIILMCSPVCKSSSGSDDSRRDPGPAADLIVNVKRIWTGDRAQPWAEALAARGGSIIAVGDLADVMRFRGHRPA